METPVFTKTMGFTTFCKTMSIEGMTFIPYTVKTGKRKGQPGYFCKITVGDAEVLLSVSSKLVPAIKAKTASKDLLQVSNVTWPDGDNGVIVHPAGEDAMYISA